MRDLQQATLLHIVQPLHDYHACRKQIQILNTMTCDTSTSGTTTLSKDKNLNVTTRHNSTTTVQNVLDLSTVQSGPADLLEACNYQTI